MYKGLEQDFSTPETEVVVEDEVVKTLRRAADVVRIRGLAKHVLCDADGCVCSRGALSVVNYGSAKPFRRVVLWKKYKQVNHDAHMLLAAQILGRYPVDDQECLTSIVEWNNAPERTASDVINTLEGAASSRLAALQGKG